MKAVKVWLVVGGGIAAVLLAAVAVLAATGGGGGRSATHSLPIRSTSLPAPAPAPSPATSEPPRSAVPTTPQPPASTAPTTGPPTSVTTTKPRTGVPVPPPGSADDAVRLLQDLSGRLQQAAPASGPQPVTRAEVQAALDAQLKQMGIDIPHP
jgi:hypothetical protein